ncbi:molybdenum cofactor cytidylyltransferase [Marinobacter sp. MBR-99]|jgi:molybdenum cofactor cytidylyltransferase|uniref:nucleotidyltransferase family protein n=1 Tax=Marinobacter sp. MBR-99 TaxID=3156461 RepID=UPI0033977869
MGRRKQLLILPGGETLLARAICQAGHLSRQVRVVVGCGYPLIRYRCGRQPVAWVYHPDWAQGLSGSLGAGIQSLGPQALGVFVLLGDQPLLAPEGLRQLAERARAKPGLVWAANYGQRVGVPAWIPRSLWPEVMALEGDAGAGRLLNRAGARAIDIAGVQQDVDTPETWQAVKRLLTEQA